MSPDRSILTTRSLRRELRAAAPGTVLAALLILQAGCEHDAVPTPDRDTLLPSIDARGGKTSSDVFLGQRVVTEGTGGSGGTVLIESFTGNVEMYHRRRTVAPPAQALVGAGGLVVRNGEKVEIKGSHLFTFVDVRGGGELRLLNNTFLAVSGDVRIAGDVKGDVDDDEHKKNGPEFTVFADGIIVITGRIDTSGGDSEVSEAGHGGDVFLAAGDSTVTPDQLLLYVSGSIDTRGGRSRSQNFLKSASGRGGSIQLGSYGRLECSAKLLSRAGTSYTSNVIGGSPGGDISVVATGDILMEAIVELSASGGDSSGIPGNGGRVIITAGNGTATVDGFDIEAFGGDVLFGTTTAGIGGAISINGTTVTVDALSLNARGGDSLPEVESEGGAAGRVSFTANSLVDVGEIRVLLRGGNSLLRLVNGGTGGDFFAIANDPFGLVTFDGSLNARGGKTETNLEGPGGSYCVAGLISAASLANIRGVNSGPVTSCDSTDFGRVADAVRELDNDDATVRPDDLTTAMKVLNFRVFRIFPAAGASIDITVTGGPGGDIDIYAADGDQLATLQAGGTSLAAVVAGAPFSAATPPAGGANIETVTLTTGDWGGILDGGGDFFLLVAVEASSFESTFTVDTE